MQDRQTKHGRRKQIQYQAWEIIPKRKITQLPMPKGGTPEFKWQGWSNGGKNQNPKKSVGLQTKPPKIPGPKFNPKKSHAEFPSHKNVQGALDDITQKIETLVLNTPKNPKKILAKIFLHQKIPKSKISNPKSPSIIPVTCNLEAK